MNTKKQTILVIEDSPTDDEAFRSILGEEHRLLFSSGHKDVLEMDGDKDVDLVLLDINAPGVDAGEICAQFSANPAHHNTPIILMVKKEQECQLASLPVGVVDCITKPLQAPIVAARLQSHLKLKQYRDLWDNPSMDSHWRLDALLAREWQRALRNQTPISLVLIDIDFFKEYEAHASHSARDKCLRRIDEVLHSCVKRDMDFITRQDTHTFACLLPDTDTVGARRVCKQMQEKVAELKIPHPSSPVADRVTLSIGMATVRPTFKLDQDCLRHQAEVMLEGARKRGHNQVRSAAN